MAKKDNKKKRGTNKRQGVTPFKDLNREDRLSVRKEIYRSYYMNLETQQSEVRLCHNLAQRYNMDREELEYWKKRDKWIERVERDNKDQIIYKEIADNLDDNLPAVQKNETKKDIHTLLEEADIPDQWKLFIMYYLHSYNISYASEMAGYANPRNSTSGFKALQDDRVKTLIKQIKRLMHEEIYITGHDIINEHIKIAFADITEYVEFNGQMVNLRDSNNVNGQLITEVRSGRDGVSIKLADKMKSLDRLEKLFDVIPDKKIILEEKKFEFQKELAGQASDENTKVTIVNDIS